MTACPLLHGIAFACISQLVPSVQPCPSPLAAYL